MLPPTALGYLDLDLALSHAKALALVQALALVLAVPIPVESHQNRRLQRGPRALHYAVGGQKAATLLPPGTPRPAAVRHKGA